MIFAIYGNRSGGRLLYAARRNTLHHTRGTGIFMEKSRESTERIARQALAWALELGTEQQPPSLETRAAFERWLRSSPDHACHYLLASVHYAHMKRIAPRPPAAHAEWLERGRRLIEVVVHGESPVSMAETLWRPAMPVRPRQAFRASLRELRLSTVAAGLLAMLMGAGLLFGLHSLKSDGPRWQTHQTASGRTANVSLKDGSSVSLGPATFVRTRFSTERRDMQIQRGSASVSVAGDRACPVYVLVKGGLIEARRAKFSVAVSDRSSRIHVDKGTLTISGQAFPEGVVLTAESDARISADGRLQLPPRRAVQSFVGATLAELAARINEAYAFQVAVEGAAREFRFSGMVDIGDPRTILQMLAMDAGLEVQMAETSAIVRMHQDVM